MSQIKWIRITTDMFEDEKIDFIDSLPDKDTILILWIKLLALAGKVNDRGLIYLTEEIPYTEEMLSHKFKRPINTVKLAIETFKRLGMIHLIKDGHIAISNWEKHQNIEGMAQIREQNRIRKQSHRDRQKLLENKGISNMSRDSHSDVTQQNKNKIKNKKKEDTRQTTKSDFQLFIDFYFQQYKEKFKTDPPFKGGRDGRTVKTLLKVMTVDILKTTVNRYLETEDLFFKKNGYDIPRFEKYLDGIKCGAYASQNQQEHEEEHETSEPAAMQDTSGRPLPKLSTQRTAEGSI